MRARFVDTADIWLTPATPSAAPGRETTGDPVFNSPWSYCGFPAVSIPCGRSDEGLPVGLQLIGLPDNDDQLLQAALWCEKALS
jgi:aspartyl-tRNA(Asn)/glutamyl-tRNA(Gln) amidotransferase subunit A